MKVFEPMLVAGLSVMGFAAGAGEAAEAVMECTFKLFNQDSTATCFLVHHAEKPGDVYLVTAAHVLEKAKGEEAVLVLREAMDDGTWRRRDLPFKIRAG
ncbi:MAG: hypothetical protein GWO24_14580, partial [Akkermansiaceae bacterium]|nr:hypothetical protein [Akkermansiaceae bacterium]